MNTKIIATLGPKTCSKEMIKEFVLAGASVFRCNMSHGTMDWHKNAVLNVKEVKKELGKEIFVMLDTKGPEIRVGKIEGEKIVSIGDKLVLTNKKASKDNEIEISFDKLYLCVNKGNIISLDSGKIDLLVLSVEGQNIITEVKNAGVITTGRHVNVPGVRIDLPILLDSDKEFLTMGKEIGFDYLAASFIRDEFDIIQIKTFLGVEHKDIKIISKIEHSEALKNIDKIIKFSDEIMIARGDLGIEVPFYEIPVIEEMLIKKCKEHSVDVIVATQMLISMVDNTIPTRAEVTDVAFAVQLGANKIMLSDETASGKYPVRCIEVMKKIAEYTEQNGPKITLH